jgi:hypothetical protein
MQDLKRNQFVILVFMILLAACQGLGGGSEAFVAEGYLLPFPMPMADDSQIDAARSCASRVEAIEAELFPESMSDETLAGMEIPDDDCERAAMALAFANREENDQFMPEVNITPWVEMVNSNPAMAFIDPVFFTYLGVPGLVSPPPWAGDALDQLVLRYVWYGMGEEVEYEIYFTPSAEGYNAEGQVNGASINATADSRLIEDVIGSLSGFIPIHEAAQLIVCMDNYPSWQIELTYSDGQIIDLTTADSNIFYLGGPWFANVDDQVFLQVSGDLVEAVIAIVEELELPIGEPAGMTCHDMETPLVDRLFPGEEASE